MHFVHEANRPAASQPTAHNNNGFNNIPEPRFRVTRLFIGGILKGLTHTGEQSFRSTVGFECHNPIGGSPYRITACEQII